MGNKKIKAMSLGAMIAAIYGALFFLDSSTGNVIGYYLYFILPALIVYYIHYYGIKNAIMLSVAIFFVTLFTGPASLFYSVSSVITGIVIGYGHERNISGNKMIFISILISIINNILLYTVFAKVFNMELVGEVSEILNELPSNMADHITLQMIKDYAPLLILGMGAVEGYLLITVLELVLPRIKIPFKYKINFLNIMLPKYIGILSVVLVILSKFVIDNVYLNYLTIIFYFLVFIQGFSLISLLFIFRRFYVGYFICCIGLFIPYVQAAYFVVGMVDIFIGLKKKLINV